MNYTEVTATGTIQYRFTCEQCGTTTPWYSITLIKRGTANGSGQKAAEAANRAAQQALLARFAQVHRDVEKGDYPDSYTVQGGNDETLFTHLTCPQCGAIQSWSAKSAKRKFGTVFLIALLVFIAYAAFFILSANFFSGVATAVWNVLGAWTIVIPFVILFGGLAIDSVVVRAQVNRKLRRQSGGKRFLPEINWNGFDEPS